MTPEERQRFDNLCTRIAVEKDPKIFDDLVRDLNDLLSVKYDRIHIKDENKPR